MATPWTKERSGCRHYSHGAASLRMAIVFFGPLVAVAACSQSNGSPSENSEQVGEETGSESTGGERGAFADGGSPNETGGLGSGGSGNASNSGGEPGSGGHMGSGGNNDGDDSSDVRFEYDPNKDALPTLCVEESIVAQPLEVDMYIILDRTGSMTDAMPAGEDCQLGPTNTSVHVTKWCKATQALSQYFTSTVGTGHLAALQFMVPEATTTTECSASPENLHSQPEVPLTELPSTWEGPLVTALNEATPTSPSTAIESALNGIALFTLENRSPGRQMIGILVTDGEPSLCSQLTSTLARIPRQHHQETGIPTFIVGMTGAEWTTLEAIALDAGGPTHSEFCDANDPNATCHYWSVGDGDPEAFVAALEAIQQSATGCEFSVPATGEGLANLESIRVESFPAGDSGGGVILKQAANVEACDEESYFAAEVNGVPTIRLCPLSCAALGNEGTIHFTIECEGT